MAAGRSHLSRIHLRSVIAAMWIGLFGLSVCMAIAPGQHANAQGGPPPDYTCRMCHGNSKDALIFPSGERLSLQVALDALDKSAHRPWGQASVFCTDCHDDKARYRVPHRPLTAPNRDVWRVEMAKLCTNCHYPHRPHHIDMADNEAPNCIDCHGSHAIAPAASIPQRMPDACLGCHDDRDRTWAETLLAPRFGLGEGATGYVGSTRCMGCHEEEVRGAWRHPQHAFSVQNAIMHPDAILADFSKRSPLVDFTQQDIFLTIGERWTQQYVGKNQQGDLVLLPAQWNIDKQVWEPYRSDVLASSEKPWPQACGGCHLTGFNQSTGGFREAGVGCEGCHGPGEAHATDPEQTPMTNRVEDQVCGACHSRGRSPKGHPYPDDFIPGESLSDYFQFTSDPAAIWPDGSARLNHQQYMDWSLGSPMAQSDLTQCTTCHAPHGEGVGQAKLRQPLNVLCINCHADKRALIKHTPYHQYASQHTTFLCTDCHMPAMTESAIVPDAHNHSMLQPDPQASIHFGGLKAMPNACNQCHRERSETPEWAVNIIRSAQAIMPPPSEAYQPDITITPPPPPTPIPAAWQLPEPAGQGAPIFHWIFVAGSFIMILIVILIYRFARREKAAHA